MPKTFTNVKEWIEHCDYLNAHPEAREVYVATSSQSTASRPAADSTNNTEEINMPNRISMNDVTTSDAGTGSRYTGVDVLKYRETHGGKAPPRSAATHDGAGARRLAGIELFKYRETHGGLTPDQVAAKSAERSPGSRR